MDRSNISRRGFLKGAAAGALGIASFGFSSVLAEENKEKQNNVINWADAADLVVVGGGGAGFCAAIEAGWAGASVLILEKADICGGDTLLSGGMIMAADTQLQKDKGIDDSLERFVEREMRYAGEFTDKDMIREMVMASPDEVQFMIDRGHEYVDLLQMWPAWGYDEDVYAPRTHWVMSNRPGHFNALKKTVDGMDNVKIYTRCEAEKLLVNENNEVIGVQTVDGLCYRANKGVLLATASFGRNTEMSKRYNTMNYWAVTMENHYGNLSRESQCKTNTGDGIRMAQEIGADLALSQANCVSGLNGGYGGSGSLYGAIMVNKRGNRFMQENANWAYASASVFREAVRLGDTSPYELNFWLIADQETVDKSYAFKGYVEGTSTVAKPDYAKLVQKADTLEELAGKCGIDADTLKSTVERWNGMVEAGVDTDFDRKSIDGMEDMGTLSKAPFYALPYIPYSMGSFGGLRVNHETQVLRPNGEPISRLYAAGSIISGMFTGSIYNACGWAILGTVHWGRKAGKNIAALEPWTTEKVEAVSRNNTEATDIEKAIANASGHYNAGVYTAVGAGRNGDVKVSVEFTEKAITAVKILEHTETAGISDTAITDIPKKVILAQSADVDVISGVTMTSDAILQAIRDCISQSSK